ncbi:AmpG family muropeptide MFS transporter [Usitatibacter palustris]|uniref:Anhydromuropeptide permease n=1 Tax=Usitatibacter palustris TaxID=2732487 RepID=A0A6M4HDM1_9PROT|nr:MFS transporter [Usitatibacter palustris]QJR16828.1 Anhydromuropeptide permease [Usitatibacter palustris]
MPPNAYNVFFRERKLAVLLLLGYASGLPISLVTSTFQAWATVEGVSLVALGMITLVQQPYTFKFLWAPFMDRYAPPFLGRRRGWILITQVALVGGIAWMSMYSPGTQIATMALIAVFVAFASASQDIVADAYRTDMVTNPRERGLFSAFFVVGYRIALLVAGAFALLLAAGTSWLPAIGWQNTYLAMAALMGIGIAATFWAHEPNSAPAPKTLQEAVFGPLVEFVTRPGALVLLAVVVLYKVGDAFALSLTTPFLIRGVGFSLEDVAYANKVMALIATLVGVIAGGVLMLRWGLFKSLLVFGILQAISNLAYAGLAVVGKDYTVLYAAIGFDNLCGGMGTASFVALQMALCNPRFTAFQYALISALAALGRVYVGPAAGYMTDPQYMGLDWPTFFVITFFTALPGLFLLWWKRATVIALDKEEAMPGSASTAPSPSSR